jgi:hypothetical protein
MLSPRLARKPKKNYKIELRSFYDVGFIFKIPTDFVTHDPSFLNSVFIQKATEDLFIGVEMLLL